MSLETDVYDDIADYLENHYSIEVDKVDPSATFEDVGLDSLGLLGIAEILERKYTISLNDERIASIKTFGELVDAVRSRSEESSAKSL
ncbi:acyl carrier protein [Nocardia vinacea]|uniref:Acyl carrier protein n=1 Tax=Nocardia vinacea TaxID=96468 RepID=A0ABZ1Z0K5_9NOCA|nr:acyl carrier protein [Nocardia vinacea]